jgi:2-oxo-4-hydroxy-4-carboxy--5-ureidoimidazoline (OHCU) decarboxylase
MLATAVDRLDRLSEAEFVEAMAPLFEGAPRFLARLAGARPFGSPEALFERALEIALAMPEFEQRELLDAHPRLGAPPGSVSALSFVEQGYDREAADAAAEAERARVDADLGDLQDEYESRYGFRYCVFVAGRPRAALVPGLRAALRAGRDAELRRGLADVVAIARDRYAKLAEPGT